MLTAVLHDAVSTVGTAVTLLVVTVNGPSTATLARSTLAGVSENPHRLPTFQRSCNSALMTM